MAPAMTALGRSFQQQQLHQWLRVLLWDDDQHRGDEGQNRIDKLTANNSKAMGMLSSRLQGKYRFEYLFFRIVETGNPFLECQVPVLLIFLFLFSTVSIGERGRSLPRPYRCRL